VPPPPPLRSPRGPPPRGAPLEAARAAPGAAVPGPAAAPPPPPAPPPVSTADPYTVTVRQVLPPEMTNESGPTAPVTISSASPQATGLNFLNYQQTTLSGTVYNDANANGRQDPGEPGLPGVQVAVTVPGQADPVLLTTDANGFWQDRFDPRGSYTVKVVAPAGASQTPLPAVLRPGTVTALDPPELDLGDLNTNFLSDG